MHYIDLPFEGVCEGICERICERQKSWILDMKLLNYLRGEIQMGEILYGTKMIPSYYCLTTNIKHHVFLLISCSKLTSQLFEWT